MTLWTPGADQIGSPRRPPRKRKCRNRKTQQADARQSAGGPARAAGPGPHRNADDARPYGLPPVGGTASPGWKPTNAPQEASGGNPDHPESPTCGGCTPWRSRIGPAAVPQQGCAHSPPSAAPPSGVDGAIGVAEAFCGGEMHGYLTFRSNAHAVAACTVVSAALGTAAPQPRQVSAIVHGVHCDVTRDLTVYTHDDTPVGGRKEAPPTQAVPPPPRAKQPPLTEADVRRLIADIVRQPLQEGPVQVGQPAQQPVTGAALLPPRAGLAPRMRPYAGVQAAPSSRKSERQHTVRHAAAPRLPERPSDNSADPPRPKAANTAPAGVRGSRLAPMLAPP